MVAKGVGRAGVKPLAGWPERAIVGLFGLLAVGLLCLGPAAAQPVAIPNFWDPRARPERPDLAGIRTLRFLTDDDYPPLHFAGPDGAPTGFAVELARAACERLALACTVQVRRFDTLLDALAEHRGDVISAAVPINAALHRRFAVTLPYFRIPGRFAVRRDKELAPPQPGATEGLNIGVVEGTAHEAFLEASFAKAKRRAFPDLTSAQVALRRGEIDYLFADALGLALWIGGTDAAGCCAFAGGPYLDSRYFGEGVGFVLRRDDEIVRRALDYALHRLWDEGKYAELYLRFFPVSPF
ncbi:MAG: ABC-type amino acid transport/signal transduction system, periplasmic component/domain [uncultured Microvirga sp.]|uniref:ABC-type amino acid transport/signal transduction system, periplasmic component/domain n=1 Tax=uncultured Microvirga sp. TaxID=412392 RepID=A0A6J4MG01_9HYPH|nr:MAG: ABC-type amino acid transport/signal transduction system, periplasmic component/domain [uncultured Microvirga sp.]